MSDLREEIADYLMGRHRRWYVCSAKVSYVDEDGDRQWISPLDQEWELTAGFDTQEEALKLEALILRAISDELPYGGDDWDLEVVDMEAADSKSPLTREGA